MPLSDVLVRRGSEAADRGQQCRRLAAPTASDQPTPAGRPTARLSAPPLACSAAKAIEKFTVDITTGDANGVLPQASSTKLTLTFYKSKKRGKDAGCVAATYPSR